MRLCLCYQLRLSGGTWYDWQWKTASEVRREWREAGFWVVYDPEARQFKLYEGAALYGIVVERL